ncbi:MAG: hypothetical protein SA339_03695 [Methanomassiliicoccus sp.]|nr:hypothetical protein [Methanomassiliicoccus sp.]
MEREIDLARRFGHSVLIGLHLKKVIGHFRKFATETLPAEEEWEIGRGAMDIDLHRDRVQSTSADVFLLSLIHQKD